MQILLKSCNQHNRSNFRFFLAKSSSFKAFLKRILKFDLQRQNILRKQFQSSDLIHYLKIQHFQIKQWGCYVVTVQKYVDKPK